MDFDVPGNCCGCAEAVGALNRFGMCADCWVDLTPEDRAVLQGREVKIQPIQERLIPATPRWKIALVALWRSAVAAVLFYLLLRRGG